MGAPHKHGKEAAKHERAIRSLSAHTGVAAAEVRALFMRELTRLEHRAKVRTYLAALTISNVRAMLPAKGESFRTA